HQPNRDSMARARDSFLWKMELDLYRLFDGVLFINEQESRLVQSQCPAFTHFVPPMMPWEIRPERETGNAPGGGLGTDETFDLIFVGSDAPANVRGITFFYQEIFVPYLRKHRVRMTIVGKVCDHLVFCDWYVNKLGVIPGDLREYYEQSKIVIIPILEGSG